MQYATSEAINPFQLVGGHEARIPGGRARGNLCQSRFVIITPQSGDLLFRLFLNPAFSLSAAKLMRPASPKQQSLEGTCSHQLKVSTGTSSEF